MYRISSLFFIFCMVIILGCPASALAAFKTKLSSTQIQNAMVQHFPLREYSAFARLTLNIPDVLLSKGSKEVVLMMPIDANVPDQPLKQGHAQIGVFIEYNPANGGLYFSDPRVIKFEMPSVSKDMHEDLRLTLDNIFKNSLPLVQIFKVEESDLNHSLYKSVMKSFSINDGFMNVEFGFD